MCAAARLHRLHDGHVRARMAEAWYSLGACAGARSQRRVNPLAFAKGTIFVQCQGCEAWHQLVDNKNLIEEYDLRVDET